MDELFDTWTHNTLPAVLGLNDSLRRRYSGDGLSHFQRVAKVALETFKDEHLARAAFLHGVHRGNFSTSLLDEAGPQVLAILSGRTTLRSMADVGPRLPERLFGKVLPGLKDVRPALLLVLDQIDHVDPAGTIAKWTLDSYENVPVALPQYEIPPLLGTNFLDLTARSNFLRYVVDPTARFVEMFNESRIAANVDLLHRDVARFSTLFSLLRTCSTPGGERDEILQLFRLVFAERQVTWEWRSLGHLDGALSTDVGSARRAFPLTGSVLILVESGEEAYAALRKLHEHFRHDWKCLKDNLDGARKGWPRALTSMVYVADFQQYFRVEILVRDVYERRRQYPTLNTQAKKSETPRSGDTNRSSAQNANEITVFTPDGLHRFLPRGATVLNFAYAVHNDFVTLAQRARVNRQFVELSHVLSDGDVVLLELADVPHLLPKDWRSLVAPGTITKIQKKYKQSIRPHLIKTGARAIQARILSAGCEVESASRLDEICVRVGSTLVSESIVPALFGHPHLTAEWWYVQLALFDHNNLGFELPFQLILDGGTREAFLEKIVITVLSETKVDISSLTVPKKTRERVSRARLCLQCRPILTGSLLGEVVEKVLVLHHPGKNCIATTTPVVVRGPRSKTDLYYLRTINRTGLAAEVFDVFAKAGAEVVDVSATRMGAQKGVFRIQVEHLTGETRDAIDRNLEKLVGVIEVRRLDDKRVPEERLGGPLPPRKQLRVLDEGVVDPFFCGDKIIDEAYFYGRRDQKTTLAKLLHDVASSLHATTVWIRGPKKVGKSSLALSFLREIASRDEGHAEYVEAERGETWSRFAERFGKKLSADVSYPTLADAVRARAASGGPFAIVIDEAVNLLMNTVASGELEDMLRFKSEVSSCPGVLLVWIGPAANAETLPEPAKHLLQSALRMDVPPLGQKDIERMLKCEQLSFSRIVADRNLARAVNLLTGGHPLWVASLGRAMWDLSRRRNQAETAHFDLPLLREAERLVCADDILFHDRLASEHWSDRKKALARDVLEVLARHSGRRLRKAKMKMLSAPQILEQLGNGAIKSEVTSILEELRLRETVVAEQTDRGRSWRLTAPLLADHIAAPEWFDE